MDECCFDEKYGRNRDMKFDLILMVHVVYYMDARSFLTKTGKLLIFVMADKIGGLSNTEDLAMIGGERNPHYFTSKTLVSALAENGIQHQVMEFPRKLNVTQFIEENAIDVITFLLLTNYLELESWLREEIREKVVREAVRGGEGRWVLVGNCALVTVQQSCQSF